MSYIIPIRLVFVYLLICLLTTAGSAQIPHSLDSLMSYLRTAPADSNYLKAQTDATFQLIYKRADYVRSDSLARQQIVLAQKLANWPALVKAYSNRATAAYLKGNYQQALTHFQQALQMAEQYPVPPLVRYQALGNVATGYDKLNQPEKTMEAALRAVKWQEQHQIRPRYPTPHRLIGGALVKMGRMQQALPYYQQAGEIFRELKDPRGIAIFENQLGDLYNELKQPRQALPRYQQCLKMAKEMNFDLLQVDALSNMARTYLILNQPALGIPLAKQALTLAEKQKNDLAIAYSNGHLGRLHAALNKDAEAEAYLKKAIVLISKQADPTDTKIYTQALADLYAKQQRFKDAYTFELQKTRLIDSTATVRTNTEVQRLLTRYETEKKEARIRLLEKEKQFQAEATARAELKTNAMLVVTVLLLLLSIAVGAWLINRGRLRRLEDAQKIRKQIAHDLHDEIGSTLSSISLLSGMVNGLIDQNRPETAQRMIQKIYTDARQILEAMDEIIWTINPGNDSLQQLALRLQAYARPLIESQGTRLAFTIDPSVNNVPMSMDVRRHLYLIGKEAINNLAKYANATEATVRFSRAGNQLQVQIEDNGQGFDPNQPSSRTGQQSMQDRAKAIGGQLAVDSAPGQGTRLNLTVGHT